MKYANVDDLLNNAPLNYPGGDTIYVLGVWVPASEAEVYRGWLSEDDLEMKISTLSGDLEAAINDGRWLAVAELERQIRSLNAQINV